MSSIPHYYQRALKVASATFIGMLDTTVMSFDLCLLSEDTPLDNYVVMQPSSLDKGTPPLEDERASPPSLEEEGYMTINRDELEGM